VPKGPIPQKIRAAVRERSGGVCEVCHQRPATDQHHRLYQGRGGAHDVENLLDVCGPGNVSGCHGRAHGTHPKLDTLPGTSISQWDKRSPAEIPFTDALGYVWVLFPNGTKAKVR
jgi:hypothetical protein